jgi:hypothetical protein
MTAVLLPPVAAADSPDAGLKALHNLPLIFEANTGQTDPAVKFLSRGSGYTLFLTPTEAVQPPLVCQRRDHGHGQ